MSGSPFGPTPFQNHGFPWRGEINKFTAMKVCDHCRRENDDERVECAYCTRELPVLARKKHVKIGGNRYLQSNPGLQRSSYVEISFGIFCSHTV